MSRIIGLSKQSWVAARTFGEAAVSEAAPRPLTNVASFGVRKSNFARKQGLKGTARSSGRLVLSSGMQYVDFREVCPTPKLCNVATL